MHQDILNAFERGASFKGFVKALYSLMEETNPKEDPSEARLFSRVVQGNKALVGDFLKPN